MTTPHPRPDWTITGAPFGDGQVAVYASKKLDSATLKQIAGRADSYTLELTMRDFTVAVGPTYQEALRRLFEAWSPDTPPATLGASDQLTDDPHERALLAVANTRLVQCARTDDHRGHEHTVPERPGVALWCRGTLAAYTPGEGSWAG